MSKRWLGLISDPYFFGDFENTLKCFLCEKRYTLGDPEYLIISEISGFKQWSKLSFHPNSSFDDKAKSEPAFVVMKLMTCNDLVLSSKNRVYFICNPYTSQCVYLPLTNSYT